jgi:hypothetical protein
MSVTFYVMPYTVLKISRNVENRIEVAGEFPNEAEAHEFIEAEQSKEGLDGVRGDHVYSVEAPPSTII